MDQFAFFCMLTSVEPASFVEKAIFFPLDIFIPFVQDQVVIGRMPDYTLPTTSGLRARSLLWPDTHPGGVGVD